MATRRSVLTALCAAALPKPSWARAGSPAYLAAAREIDGGFAFFGLSKAGEDIFRIPLPARAHAGAGHPTRPEAVLFARRPGTYALVVDCLSGIVTHHLHPPEGQSINGHGTFAEDGQVLITSEQVAETSEGRLGLWAVDEGYRRIGDIPTGGIGPHDIKLLSDGRLAVANGGIATDPTDRRKLNLQTMQPNLSIMTLNGPSDLIALDKELWQNSIRHLALGPNGELAFAMQWQGDQGAQVPLMGLFHHGTVTLAETPEAQLLAMQGYAGSIAFDGTGQRVAISSPRGGRVQAYGLDGVFQNEWARADICGLATSDAGFLASDGGGGLLEIRETRMHALGLKPRAWDNHIVQI